MIKLNVASIKKELVGKLKFNLEVSGAELALVPAEIDLSGPVVIDGSLTNTGEVLLLQAELTTSVKRNCARCLSAFTVNTEVSVLEEYYPLTVQGTTEDVFFYENDVVDVTEALREALLLAEPLQPLCHEDCRGLCPKCGCNLNQESCACSKQSVDPRLAVLKNLKF